MKREETMESGMKQRTTREHLVAAVAARHSEKKWAYEPNYVNESGTVAELEIYDGLTFVEWCAMMDEYESDFLPHLHEEGEE